MWVLLLFLLIIVASADFFILYIASAVGVSAVTVVLLLYCLLQV